MGFVSFVLEIESPISASRLFKALILDYHNLCKKLMPEFIVGADIIQGDGGVGSIKRIDFIHEGEVRYAKHRIDELDEKRHRGKCTVIEGDALEEKMLTRVVYKFELAENDNGGCVCKMVSEYYTDQNDVEIREEDIELGKEIAYGRFYKKIEDYLLANPEAYAS